MLPVDAFTLPHVRRRKQKRRREKREEKGGRREGEKASLNPYECYSARLAVFGPSKTPKNSEASGGPGTVVQTSWNPGRSSLWLDRPCCPPRLSRGITTHLGPILKKMGTPRKTCSHVLPSAAGWKVYLTVAVFSHVPMRKIGFLGRWGTHACPQCLPSDTCPYPKPDLDVSAASYPSQTSAMPCHAIPITKQRIMVPT